MSSKEGETRKIIGVDLFSGAGGLSLGARWAGIDVHMAIENDFYAAETYKKNHPGTLIKNVDIDMVRAIDRENKLNYPCKAKTSYAKILRGLSSCRKHLVNKNSNFVIECYSYIPQEDNSEDISENLMPGQMKAR